MKTMEALVVNEKAAITLRATYYTTSQLVVQPKNQRKRQLRTALLESDKSQRLASETSLAEGRKFNWIILWSNVCFSILSKIIAQKSNS